MIAAAAAQLHKTHKNSQMSSLLKAINCIKKCCNKFFFLILYYIVVLKFAYFYFYCVAVISGRSRLLG